MEPTALRCRHIPDRSRMVGIIVTRAVLNFPIQFLDTATHGVRIVNVDVVVFTVYRLLYKRLLDLDA